MSQTGKSQRRLRNFLIYPAFQLRLIGISFLISLVPMILLYMFQMVSFHQQRQIAIESGWTQDHSFFIYLDDFQGYFNLVFYGALVTSFMISLIMGVTLSHRVAGPLVKMKNFLLDVAQNPEKDKALVFRKGDYFQEVADAYNERFKK